MAKEKELKEEKTEETPQTEAQLEAEETAEEGNVLVEELTPEEALALKEDLEAARAQAEENLDGWQRTQAELANYKKRVERDRAQQYQDILARILLRYLEVLDDLERALENRPQDGAGAEWAEGIELIARKLKTLLDNEGVQPMQAEGQQFDPNYHEAISQEPSSDHESGEIIEVVQQGYMLGERVLRPARVRVAS